MFSVQRSRLLKAVETDSKPEIVPSTRPVLSFSEKLAFEGRPVAFSSLVLEWKCLTGRGKSKMQIAVNF